MLRRPGMYGDAETAVRTQVEHLARIEKQPTLIRDLFASTWAARGLVTNTGPAATFARLLPGRADRRRDHEVMTVYAEFAWDRGWLRPDRLLGAQAHADLRARARSWTAARDRTWPDVVAQFGQPSVHFGGTSPRYGKSLAYISEDPAAPPVVFHLWNAPDTAGERPQPLLQAVRFGTQAPFARTFTYTPDGLRRRPETQEAPWQ